MLCSFQDFFSRPLLRYVYQVLASGYKCEFQQFRSLYICSPKNKFFFITRLSTLHMTLNMSSTNQPAWMSASFLTFSVEEKKIIFEFCNLMNLFCKCETKKIIGFKYCNLCLNLLINIEESIIQINKQEIISVKNLLKYNKYLLK